MAEQRGISAIEHQKSCLRRALASHIMPGQAYALLDFPDYSNVGDSAIWCGAMMLLADIAGRGPAYVSTLHSFDAKAMDSAVHDGPIFLNGGGNFGDIWPAQQRFRMEVLKCYPNRRVVQLPQSIHYRENDAIRTTAAMIGGATDYHLMVRDQPSLAFASKNFDCPVNLLPDCAVGLGVLSPRREATTELFVLLRTDHESAEWDVNMLRRDGAIVDDWLEEPRLRRGSLRRRAVIKTLFSGSLSQHHARASMFEGVARQRVERGLNQLGQGRRVVTDRLHGHILSTLLGKPHIALDNNYGKVGHYMKQWNSDVPYAKYATDIDELKQRLAELQSVAEESRPAESRRLFSIFTDTTAA